MKRMKNSVKAIIITICAVIVAVSAIVGIVLLNRDKPEPPEKIGYELTSDQKDLMELVDKNAKIALSDEKSPMVDMDDYVFVDEDGETIHSDLVEGVYDGYFVAEDGDDTLIYLFDEDEQGNQTNINLFDHMVQQELIPAYTSISVNEVYNGYAAFTYTYQTAELANKKVLSFVCFNDVSNIFVVKEIEFDVDGNKLFLNEKECMSVDVEFGGFYTITTLELIDGSNVGLHLTAFAYSNSEDGKVFEFYHNNQNEIDYELGKNGFSIRTLSSNDKIVYVYENDMVEYDFQKIQDDSTYQYTFSKDFVFIEKATRISNIEDIKKNSVNIDTGTNGAFVDYSYQTYYYRTKSLKEFKTDYAMVSLINRGYSEAFTCYIFEQNVDEQHILNDNGKISYLDSKLNKIISYESKSKINSILYSNGVRFLTNEGIYSTKLKIEAEKLFDFVNDSINFELRSENIVDNYFVIYGYENDFYNIMTINEVFLFDKYFEELFEYDGRYFIAKEYETGDYYWLDAETATSSKIENYFEDEDYTNELMFRRFGYFFVGDEGNLTLMNHKNISTGNENIVDFEYNKNDGYELNLFFGDSVKAFNYSENYEDDYDLIEYDYSRLVKTFASVQNVETYKTIADSFTFTNAKLQLVNSRTLLELIVYNKRRPSSAKIIFEDGGNNGVNVCRFKVENYTIKIYDEDNEDADELNRIQNRSPKDYKVDKENETVTWYWECLAGYSQLADVSNTNIEGGDWGNDDTHYVYTTTLSRTINTYKAASTTDYADSLGSGNYSTSGSDTIKGGTLKGYTYPSWTAASSITQNGTTSTYTDSYFYYGDGTKTRLNGTWYRYAIYQPNKYKVTYHLNLGSTVTNGVTLTECDLYVSWGNTQTKTETGKVYNVAFSLLGVPTMEHFTCLGWSTSSTATSATYTGGQSVSKLTTTNDGEVHLYAVWTTTDLTVKFNFADWQNNNTPTYNAYVRIPVSYDNGKWTDGTNNYTASGTTIFKNGSNEYQIFNSSYGAVSGSSLNQNNTYYIMKKQQVATNAQFGIHLKTTEAGKTLNIAKGSSWRNAYLGDLSYTIEYTKGSTTSTQSVSSFSIKYKPTTMINDLLNANGSVVPDTSLWEKCLDKANITITGSQYRFGTWGVRVTSETTSTKCVLPKDIATNRNLESYFKLIKPSDPDSETVIEFFAIYETKPYEIGYSTENINGSASIPSAVNKSTDTTSITNVNLSNTTMVDALYYCQENVSKSLYSVAYSQDANITIKLNMELESGVYEHLGQRYYIFDRVVIEKLGWKYWNGSSYEYGYADVELKYSDDGKDGVTGWSISLLNAYDSAGNKKTDATTRAKCAVSTVKKSDNTTVDYYYIGSYNTSDSNFKFNRIYITQGTSETIAITVRNCGIAGVYSGETFTVTETSATGGTKGFSVKAYAKSNYTKQDDVVIDTNTGEGVTGKGSALTLITQKVDGSEFWINNYKCTLNDNTKTGYFSYSSKSGNEITFNHSSSESIENKDGFKNRRVFYDAAKGIVYYPISFKSELNALTSYNITATTTTTANKNEINFYNTQIIAIRPEQYKTYLSSDASSVGAAEYFYELKSYLSAITINDKNDAGEVSVATYNFDYIRDVNNTSDTFKTYWDMNFAGSSTGGQRIDFYKASGTSYVDPYSASTPYEISYMGYYYRVYDCYYFTHNDRNYVLYLTTQNGSGNYSDNTTKVRANSTHEVMYFLYSDIKSQVTKGVDTANRGLVEIKLTFMHFDNQIKLNLNTANSAAGREDTFNDEDKPLVYRYGVSAGSSNEATNYKSSLTYVSGYSSNVSPVAYFDVPSNDASKYYYSVNAAYKYNPTDFVMFELQPTDGYIIKSLTVKVGGVQLLHLDYDKTTVNETNDSYTFTNSAQVSGSTVTRPDILYKGTGNKFYKMNQGSYSSTTGYSGVMLAQNTNEKGVWHSSKANYNSSYYSTMVLMIAGVYENVEINVETMSYAEFYFIDNQNQLGFTESGGMDLAKLTMLINPDNTNWSKVVYGTDAIIRKSETNNHYRVIFEGKAKSLRNGIKIFASGEDYSASFTKGTLYGDDEGLMFPHLTYSSGDDFTGRRNGSGSLYSNVLTDSNNIAYSDGLKIGNKSIAYNDYATYVFLRDFRRISTINGSLATDVANYHSDTHSNIYAKTTYWEKNNKYLFVMTVEPNSSTFGINSYLYNEQISTSAKPFVVEITGVSSGAVQVAKADAAKIQPGMVAVIKSKAGVELKTDLKITQKTDEGAYVKLSVVYGTSPANMSGVTAGCTIECTTYRHSAQNLGAEVGDYFEDEANKIQWVNSNGFAAYQLDYVGPYDEETGNYYKTGSWFNDTILTQIEYGYAGELLQWQDAGVRNEFINTQTSNGYAIQYKYYEIPGYYLNYIEFDTVDFGRVFIDVYGLFNDDSNDVEMSLFNKSGIGYYFDLTYNNGVFTLLLYNDGENKGYESLGFISNEVTVNFYSYPYTYNLRLHDNQGHSSSYDSLTNTGAYMQDIKYDNITYIDTYLSMTGYTFVGWASEKYYNAESESMVSRYGNSIWNSSSYWKSLVTGAKNYFAFANRDDLIELKRSDVYTSDFYVKSSNDSNKNKTAFFITDTGFASSTYGTVENYNFWASHAKTFISSINNYGINLICDCGKTADECDCFYKGTIHLYAIWKANVYTMQFEVNDSNVKYNNGSTAAQLQVNKAVDNTGSFDDRFDSTGLYFNLAINANNHGTTKYYSYITFDTDDWYITDSDDGVIDSVFSYYDETESHKIWSDNLLDVIVDRYGYSWLGWFSKKENNIYEKNKNTQLLSANRIFGSNYYTNDLQTLGTLVNAAKDEAPEILMFDWTLYNNFNDNGSLVDIYSEFVYKGQRKVDDTKAAVYSYFYDYSSSGVSGVTIGDLASCQYNPDYLNVFTYSESNADGTWFTSFDTSLTYDCYKYDLGNLRISRSLADNSPAIRYIKVYAYWQINFYEFVIDWQDVLPTGYDVYTNSLHKSGYGSSKAGILSGTNVVQESFAGAYFDDKALSDRINKFLPVRVGFDFLGWAFYYDTAKNNQSQVVGTHREEGKQDTSLWLCEEFTTYYGATKLPLYNVAECVKNQSFANTEGLGNDGTLHYVYMFAIWQSQTFTINVDLNIDYEELENLYEKDSAFGVALYNNVYNADNVTISGIDYSKYKGIRSDYYKYDSGNYTEIVANLNFVINFDQNFSTAYCVVNENKNGTTEVVEKKFYLKNLFATSAGYYLLGWMYNPNNSTNMLVYNTLKSMFGTDGTTVENLNAGGESYLSLDANDRVLNLSMYNKLFNTSHEHNLADEFTFTALSNIDKHGHSSNFGYITINSTNYYIACEDVMDNEGNIIDHALYFKYNGLKYYIVVYNENSADVLTNDHSFFYYTQNSVKYKVRFDTDGKAYIVTSMYGTRKVLNLRVAAFALYNANNKDAINTTSNLFAYDEEGGYYKFCYVPDDDDVFVNARAKLITTRQFTIYAHWANKNNFVININNGNNSKVEGEYTYYSNEGLAGYYTILTTLNHNASSKYKKEFFTPTNPSTQNVDGQLETGITSQFNYYDDIDINILPYYNGRYLSEMTLKFYGVEEVISNTNEDAGQMSSKFMYTTYTLKFKFDWDSKNRKIILRPSSGVVYKVNNGDDYQYQFVVDDFDQGQQLVDITRLSQQLDKLSIIDAESFDDFIFKMFKYADKTNNNEYNKLYHDDRVDMNKVYLSMDKIMSNIDITCKFSVQTYDVNFYSMLDPVQNNMKHLDNTVKSYESAFTQADFESNIDNNNEAGENGTYYSQTAFGEAKLAVIPQDCAESTRLQDVSKFNVPYGYFIYGQNYTSAFAPNRPIDEASAGNNVVAMLNTEKYGFEYIYSNGYYNYGSTVVEMKASGSDSYYAQCSPVLGPTYLFSQAVGFRKDGLSFYTFGGWYEYEKVQNNVVVFTSYDRTSEATYINNDMTLYGYYYPINTPTSIEFYTWDDEGSRYEKYNENSNQYTLNANIETFPFSAVGDVLVKSQQQLEFVDKDGIAKIIQYTKYGVNSTGFVSDEYLNPHDFDPQITIDEMMLDMVLETYWFYENSYRVLYFMNGSDKVYIKYDNGFYYQIGATRTNVEIKTTDNENYYIKATGKRLEIELKYKYGSVFDGSSLYVQEVMSSPNIDRYYKVNKVTDTMFAAAMNGTYKGINAAANAVNTGEANLIKKYQPRFYYDMHGQRYFLMARNENNSVQNSNAIYWYSSSGGDSDGVIIGSTNNIVTIKNYFVEYGSEYYTIDYKKYTDAEGSTYINPYADYKTNQVVVSTSTGDVQCYFDYDTKYLYEFISASGTYQRVSFEHFIYCPINENYHVNTTTTNSKWSTGNITIKSLPSPNIGFWYNGDKYGFVGYIMVTDEMISEMKRAPSETVGDLGGIIYQKFTQYVQVVYSKDNFEKAKFASEELYNEFVNGKSLDEAYEEFIELLYSKVGDLISSFNKDQLLSSLLLAEKYEYKELASGEIIISGVEVNIPITFKDVMADPRTGRNLSISITVKTEEPFKMISTDTAIDTNVYAVPIYSPYVMKFNENSIKTKTTTNLTIDINNMDVWHFELGSDSSYNYNKQNGDYLNFILLTNEQYQSISDTNGDLSAIIKGMSTEDRAKYLFKEADSIGDTNDVLIDMSNCIVGNTYVLVAYYNQTGITDVSKTYVVRASDNAIKLNRGADSISVEFVDMNS